MAACHQAHNIPWTILQDNLYISGPNPAFPDRKFTNFYGRTLGLRPNRAKEVKHFINKLVEAIRVFAKSRREMCDEQIELGENKVIPDDMLGQYVGIPATPLSSGGVITQEQQTLAWWRLSAVTVNFHPECYAIMIRELHHRGHVPHLLFLAQNFGRDMSKIRYSMPVRFGTDRIYRDALVIYIIINLHLLFNLYGDSVPCEIIPHLGNVNPDTLPPNWPLALTFARYDLDDSTARGDTLTGFYTSFFSNGNHNLRHTERIKGFLKLLWRIMYISEVYVRECGGEIDWDYEIRRVLSDSVQLDLDV